MPGAKVRAGTAPPRAGREQALTHGLLVTAPLMTVVLLVTYILHHKFGRDFTDEYWVAAQRVLHGKSPYRWSQFQVAGGVAFPYPAVAAVLFVPFGLLPVWVAAGTFCAILMACVAATLRVLSVRDWRVYAVAYLLFPVINGWQVGNLTLLLGLLIALTWRYRDRPLVAGLLVALAVSLKPFVWPLALWLLVTRRFRAALWALVSGLAMNAVAWGVVGFGQFDRFVQLDHRVSSTLYRTGYSLVAIVARLGLSESAGLAVLALTSAALAAVCLWLGLQRRDEAALAVTVGLMLAASPLVWNQYPALLIVPMAVVWPRLNRAWLAALVLWLCPANAGEWEALLAAAFTAAIVWRLGQVGQVGQVGAVASSDPSRSDPRSALGPTQELVVSD